MVGGWVFIIPLHLPLRKGVFSFAHLSYETYKGLPPVFADSLPDDFGNALINAWLARQGLDTNRINSIQCTALDRLLYTGTSGMGALEYQPAKETINAKPSDINVGELVGLVQKVLDERNDFSVVAKEDDAMMQLI